MALYCRTTQKGSHILFSAEDQRGWVWGYIMPIRSQHCCQHYIVRTTRNSALPLTFTPGTNQSTPSLQVNGTFTWAYPNLPTTLSSQWRLGSDNIVLQGALRTFQSQSNIPVTGEADATTWSDLLSAVNANRVDPATYNYVNVSESSPETLTLYVAGHVKFRTLVK